jgi:hypothetical protein
MRIAEIALSPVGAGKAPASISTFHLHGLPYSVVCSKKAGLREPLQIRVRKTPVAFKAIATIQVARKQPETGTNRI